ncbi:MAG: cupin domain-containing protein [Acetobacteraceae bacterium]
MDQADFDVGSRLRAVRVTAGLSQRRLAERAGVPHGQISMIEQNRNSPSVASLRKILSGVPITMAAFFEPEQPRPDARFFTAAELLDLTSKLHPPGVCRGRITLRQVGDARAHSLQILHEHYEPGADTGPVMLQHVAHEGGIVIAGEIEVTVGEDRRILKAGDAYLFDSRLPHRFRNLGDHLAELVSACAPPYL